MKSTPSTTSMEVCWCVFRCLCAITPPLCACLIEWPVCVLVPSRLAPKASLPWMPRNRSRHSRSQKQYPTRAEWRSCESSHIDGVFGHPRTGALLPQPLVAATPIPLRETTQPCRAVWHSCPCMVEATCHIPIPPLTGLPCMRGALRRQSGATSARHTLNLNGACESRYCAESRVLKSEGHAVCVVLDLWRA